jgi:putative endonuclease
MKSKQLKSSRGSGPTGPSKDLQRELAGQGGDWVTHPEKPYVLYLLECQGSRFYAGIARDAEDRFMQHLSGKGAAFTRAFEPIRILRSMTLLNKSAALKAEIALKKLPKSKKLDFFDRPWFVV